MATNKNFEIKNINLKSTVSSDNKNVLSLKGIYNLNNSEYEKQINC